jgi:hypothetical protein
VSAGAFENGLTVAEIVGTNGGFVGEEIVLHASGRRTKIIRVEERYTFFNTCIFLTSACGTTINYKHQMFLSSQWNDQLFIESCKKQ